MDVQYLCVVIAEGINDRLEGDSHLPDDIPTLSTWSTFEELGRPATSKGIAVIFGDGSEFEITVKQTKKPR